MKRNLTKSAGAPAKTGRGSVAASPGRRWLAPMAYALAVTVASGLSAPFDAQAAAEANRLGVSATAASAVPLIASAANTVAATRRAPEFALPKAAIVPNASAKRIAEDYVLSSHGQHGLVRSDISELQPNESTYVTDHNGVTHVFFDQLVNGIPVYKAHFQVNVLPNGEVLLPTSSFFPNAHAAASVTTPSLSAAQAVELAAADLGETSFRAMPVAEAVQTAFAGGTLSAEDIKPKLVYQPHGNELRLAWQFTVDRHVKEAKYLDLRYDAVTGDQIISENYVNELDSSDNHAAEQPARNDAHPRAATHNEVYRVFPLGYESPTHTGNPMAGHVLVTNPYDVVAAPSGEFASPYGWNDTRATPSGTTPEYLVTRGNNINNDSARPLGTYNAGTNTLTLDFPWDENQAPDSASNRIAATVNLFYWNNIIHDVMYNYGFNEVAGNFQINNYGRCVGCTGNHQNDGVIADALDGSQAATPSVNNANFSTPVDGSAV
jgi:extracellular elastinolytic metalloproteinase